MTTETQSAESIAPEWSVVHLLDGGAVDLSRLDRRELERLQWNEERGYAERIMASRKGSAERARLLAEGYDCVVRIYQARTAASQRSVVMGLDRRFLDMTLRLARRSADRPRLFEIGFGSGLLLEAAQDAGCEVSGIEVSSYLHGVARARLREECRDRLWLGGFLSHPACQVRDHHDCIYWNDVLEHLHPDEAADYLRHAFQMLRPGGLLVTITPNWHIRPSDITHLFLPPRSEAVGFHLKEYTLGEISRMLIEAGFEPPATPLFLTRSRAYLAGNGLAGAKRACEGLLERVPFRAAQVLCRGLGMNCTIARKPE